VRADFRKVVGAKCLATVQKLAELPRIGAFHYRPHPLAGLDGRRGDRTMHADDTLDRMIREACSVLGIGIAEEWRAAIRTHLAISLGHAEAVGAFPLPDEADPAPVFEA
jgi:1-carboxybiuret hydrolase subunit AtzG-like